MFWRDSITSLLLVAIASEGNLRVEARASFLSQSSRSLSRTFGTGGTLLPVRGGSTAVLDDTTREQEIDDKEEDSANSANDIRNDPEFATLQAYRMQQQHLLQLRATYLSEALAKRGLPLATLNDVATPEGAQPPQSVDWDCALATEEDPKSCLYSFDAEPNTKVLAPLGTTQWISLGALNRLRRTDPTKVEPMWHSQFAILKSWFDPESEYSLLQHVGFTGFALNALLQGHRLEVALGLALLYGALLFMPVLEYFFNRLLVSGLLWSQWHRWSRFVHAALPLKLLLGQMAGKLIANAFGKLHGVVKERLVELECQLLETKIPLTVEVPTIHFDDEVQQDIADFDALLSDDDEQSRESDYSDDDEEE